MRETYIGLGQWMFLQKLIERINTSESGQWLTSRGITCRRDAEVHNLEFVLIDRNALSGEDFEQCITYMESIFRKNVPMKKLIRPEFFIQEVALSNLSDAIASISSFVALSEAFPQKQHVGYGQAVINGLQEMFHGSGIAYPRNPRPVCKSFVSGNLEIIINFSCSSRKKMNVYLSITKADSTQPLDIDIFFTAFRTMVRGYLNAENYKNDPMLVSILQECKKFFV